MFNISKIKQNLNFLLKSPLCSKKNSHSAPLWKHNSINCLGNHQCPMIAPNGAYQISIKGKNHVLRTPIKAINLLMEFSHSLLEAKQGYIKILWNRWKELKLQGIWFLFLIDFYFLEEFTLHPVSSIANVLHKIGSLWLMDQYWYLIINWSP